MRAPVLLVLAALAGCSGLPPEPLIPLDAGQTTVGLTLDVPVGSRRGAGLSAWGGVGVGRGVDVALDVHAPLTVLASLDRVGRNGGPFVPPGLAVRKSFSNGVGVGVGTGAIYEAFVETTGTGYLVASAGPFVTVGSRDPSGVVGRATAHLVYEVHAGRLDSTGTRTPARRRGLAAYATVSGGPVARHDSSSTVWGGRGRVGGWLWGPPEIRTTLGPLVEDVGRYPVGG